MFIQVVPREKEGDPIRRMSIGDDSYGWLRFYRGCGVWPVGVVQRGCLEGHNLARLRSKNSNGPVGDDYMDRTVAGRDVDGARGTSVR